LKELGRTGSQLVCVPHSWTIPDVQLFLLKGAVLLIVSEWRRVLFVPRKYADKTAYYYLK
jgi:hypothetical protein